jgi:hypothetical protein
VCACARVRACVFMEEARKFAKVSVCVRVFFVCLCVCVCV